MEKKLKFKEKAKLVFTSNGIPRNQKLYFMIIYVIIFTIFLFGINAAVFSINESDYDCDTNIIKGDGFVMCVDDLAFNNLKYSADNMYLEHAENYIENAVMFLTCVLASLAILAVFTCAYIDWILFDEKEHQEKMKLRGKKK